MTLSLDDKTPQAPFVDKQAGSRWGIEGGIQSGPLKGRTLQWIDSAQCHWLAWSAEYPRTSILSSSSEGGAGGVTTPR